MEQIRRALDKLRSQRPVDPPPVDGEEARSMLSRPAIAFSQPEPSAEALKPSLLAANRIVAWDKTDARTPAFDVLRAKTLKAMVANGWSTLAITSPAKGCGKTTVALNLAFSLAHQLSSKVTLLDCDLRQPRIAAYLGVEPTGDFSAFLDGSAPLVARFVTAGGATLRVVTNKSVRNNPAELLSGSRFRQLIDDSRRDRSGRITIVDLPPLMVGDDAVAVLQQVDCALLVLGERVTKKAEVPDALQLLHGANLLGAVLNRSRKKLKGYY